MSDETKTERPKATRVVDGELQAMAKLDRLICELPDDASVARVLAWLVCKHCPEGVSFCKRVVPDPATVPEE